MHKSKTSQNQNRIYSSPYSLLRDQQKSCSITTLTKGDGYIFQKHNFVRNFFPRLYVDISFC